METKNTIAHSNLDELSTLRDWVRFFVSEMSRANVSCGHGLSTLLDEAVYLVQSALALPLSEISAFLDAKVVTAEKEKLRYFLEQRTIERKPAAYITGEAFLQGHRFLVDERVIIPRSFIAELLDDQLTPWVNAPESDVRLLDLCTGSGCLGIYAALVFENATIDCVDISGEALEVAAKNIELHQVQGRVNLIQSDLFNQVSNQYDIILSNPPYVNSQSMGVLPAEYRHEPSLALAGGDDGMDIIRRILSDSKKHLKPDGLLFVELGNERGYFEEAFPELNPIWLEVSAGDEQVFLLRQGEF